MTYLLSIDQGTTSCRAIVFDTNGKTVGLGQKEFEQHYPKPGWVEHDAEEILRTQIECIKDAVKNSKIDAKSIVAVGITNQRETTVVWDKTTGKPIYKAIVWQCRRTQELAETIKSESEEFREKTGLIPDAYFSGPKIRWILDNVPNARKLADEGKLAFGTIDTWLIWNLTKEQSHLTEPSNASRTMLYNIHNLDWDAALLRRLNVPKAMMPHVVPSNANFGTTRADLIGFEAPILANLGDQQAALFGQCCFEQGHAKCTYGTGGFLLANIGSQSKLAPGLLTTIAWQLEGEKPTYAFEGAVFIAGAAVQWLRDGLQLIKSTAESEAMAKSLDSNDGVYFVPAFVGLASPWWNSDVRGTIVGLTRGAKREHFARAALEAIAYQVADVFEDMENNGISLSELRVDGGATQNKFLLQFQADVLKAPVLKAEQSESTAWGVAALAGLKIGVIKSKKQLSESWKSDFKAKPTVDRSDDYAGWKAALRGTFATANLQMPRLNVERVSIK